MEAGTDQVKMVEVNSDQQEDYQQVEAMVDGGQYCVCRSRTLQPLAIRTEGSLERLAQRQVVV